MHLSAQEEVKTRELLNPFIRQPESIRSYFSGSFGNGSIQNEDDMEWRTFELRIGAPVHSDQRIDFVHYNEGHPENHHRDGFSIQNVYSVSVTEAIQLEIGVGPYLSFDTTTRNGLQHDDQRIGLLGSIALLYYLNTLRERNFHLRFDYNHVSMPGAHTSRAFLIGLGMNYGGEESSLPS